MQRAHEELGLFLGSSSATTSETLFATRSRASLSRLRFPLVLGLYSPKYLVVCSDPNHHAHVQEIRISYPYHPQHEQEITILRRRRLGGQKMYDVVDIRGGCTAVPR